MAKCITDWVAPGTGATVRQIADLCCDPDNLPEEEDERRTNLAIVATGTVTESDRRRAETALAAMGIR